MKLNDNTVLITGGSSGIGLELEKQLIARNNTVIICGRSGEKLATAKKSSPQLNTFQCDIAQKSDRERLINYMKKEYPDFNVLVNNAAVAHKADFLSEPMMPGMVELEVQTNLLAPVLLSREFLNYNKTGTLINITTGLIYAPRSVYPIYNATKAALHAFTQVLRKQTEPLGSKIIEVMMPVVDTAWHRGNPPRTAITAERAVTLMMRHLKGDRNEIRIDRVKMLYLLSRIAPGLACRIVNNLHD